MKSLIKRYIFYPLQFLGAAPVVGIFWILPFPAASWVGGTLARLIGPHLSVSNVARRNLTQAFPDWEATQIERTVVGMWENLGRTIGEYPALRHMDLWGKDSPVEIVNADLIDQLRDDGKPALLFLAHLGNWEYATLPALQRGLPITQLYRTLNNPYIAWLIGRVHNLIAQDLVTKGSSGARKMIQVMKNAGHLSMLIDQKLREGIPVPFFGRPAMTPQALANLAIKFDCPIIPIRVERLKGVRCRVTYYPPLEIPQDGLGTARVYDIMSTVNALLETWIRERPEQWIWVHNRWPS
jgi:Kdo2-lipid IVA lauroyltransferase/acyltransferase